MHFEGTQQIQAPREAVFTFLLDPNKVAGCAPGFISMDILAPDHFKPTLGVGVGAVKAKFTLDVQLQDIQQPDHGKVKAHGVAAGSAVDLTAVVDLEPVSDAETTMNWSADVTVSGTIASVGARLLESTAHKQIAKFFACFKQKLESPAPEAAASESPES
jgi:carbon monoxide dehydrogenase subunit G